MGWVFLARSAARLLDTETVKLLTIPLGCTETATKWLVFSKGMISLHLWFGIHPHRLEHIRKATSSLTNGFNLRCLPNKLGLPQTQISHEN